CCLSCTCLLSHSLLSTTAVSSLRIDLTRASTSCTHPHSKTHTHTHTHTHSKAYRHTSVRTFTRPAMADKKEGKTAGRVPVKKKEKKVEKKAEKKTEKPVEKETEKEKKPEQAGAGGAAEAGAAEAGAAGAGAAGAGAAGAEKQEGNKEKPEEGENGEFQLEPIELPPLEVVAGERINPFFFKFQFKNVEYSSGRNKTFLCFLVDSQGNENQGMRGYLEDEHIGPHSEEGFFLQVLPEYDPQVQYLVTWYVSSSPCSACAAKLVEVLKGRKTMRLVIYCARLFMWEEPEIQEGLKALAGAGCKLRMMKPSDFVYIWDTFVENEEETFTPWEDCQDNFEYYEEKLSEILP
ncbi:hypothetical protein SKAU_G00102020, partial [Synaphobranchus kaupii]